MKIKKKEFFTNPLIWRITCFACTCYLVSGRKKIDSEEWICKVEINPPAYVPTFMHQVLVFHVGNICLIL